MWQNTNKREHSKQGKGRAHGKSPDGQVWTTVLEGRAAVDFLSLIYICQTFSKCFDYQLRIAENLLANKKELNNVLNKLPISLRTESLKA